MSAFTLASAHADSAGPQADAPVWGRAELETFAAGKVSSVFGPMFTSQDGYAAQVRLPMAPLLMIDRVISIEAEPGSMGTGRVVAETDVDRHAWCLCDGAMPAGLELEMSQIQVLLASYLGADLHYQGERAYRALGSEVTYLSERRPRAGDTIRIVLELTGHVRTGGLHLVQSRFSTYLNGKPRMQVRNAVGGLVPRKLQAAAGGIALESQAPTSDPGLAFELPEDIGPARSFTAEQVRSFAQGRAYECFGAGFELCASHWQAPRINDGKMQLIEEVTHFEPRGGPWGRGYLRAVTRLRGDEWFFAAHFKNDPLMPAALMLDGSLQAMSFHLAALGFTREHDAATFEPVPGVMYRGICRGQVTPGVQTLSYEVIVRGLEAGPQPTLWADLVVSVDNLRIGYVRQQGLRLVPGFPVGDIERLLPVPAAQAGPAAVLEGFRLDHDAALSAALGVPSRGFGPRYQAFDGERRMPRLPAPPLQCYSRYTSVKGDTFVLRAGLEFEAEYDIAPDAWYFRDNIHRTMPLAILMESPLQAGGMANSLIGVPLASDKDLRLRNLGGEMVLLQSLGPDSGVLRVRGRITDVSRSGDVILQSLDLDAFVGDMPVAKLKTTFGEFSRQALEQQVGLPFTAAQRREIEEAPQNLVVDLRDAEQQGAGLLAGRGMLRMLDRVTGYWPTGGAAGKGRLRGEITVDPHAWFFKAHFFQDPVTPGSLGIEAMVQLLQFYMNHKHLGERLREPCFEPVALGSKFSWKYRGQVMPTHKRCMIEMEIVDEGSDAQGPWVSANAWLWVDGLRIYEVKSLTLRMVEGASSAGLLGERTDPEPAPLQPPELLDGLCQGLVHGVGPEERAALDRFADGKLLLLGVAADPADAWLLALALARSKDRRVAVVAQRALEQHVLVALARGVAALSEAGMVPELVAVEGSHPQQVLQVLDDCARTMNDKPTLLVVPLPASAGPGQTPRVPANLLDLALRTGSSVMPFRLGRLTPAGIQVRLGPALPPDVLRALPYAARAAQVQGALARLENDSAPPARAGVIEVEALLRAVPDTPLGRRLASWIVGDAS